MPNNIGTLKQSVLVINHFYDYPVISIVCPDHLVNEFIHELDHYKNIKFIHESELISSKEFQSLVEKFTGYMMIWANEIGQLLLDICRSDPEWATVACDTLIPLAHIILDSLVKILLELRII